jgi:hypothetical protein
MVLRKLFFRAHQLSLPFGTRLRKGCILHYKGKFTESFLPIVARTLNLQEVSFKFAALPPKLAILALAVPAYKMSPLLNEAAFKHDTIGPVEIVATDIFVIIPFCSLFHGV